MVLPAACRLEGHDQRRNHRRSRGAGLGVRGRGWSCSREGRPYHHRRCVWRSMPLLATSSVRFRVDMRSKKIIATILSAAYQPSIVTLGDALYRGERVSPIAKCAANWVQNGRNQVVSPQSRSQSSGPTFRPCLSHLILLPSRQPPRPNTNLPLGTKFCHLCLG
jgi:hypothetical protein